MGIRVRVLTEPWFCSTAKRGWPSDRSDGTGCCGTAAGLGDVCGPIPALGYGPVLVNPLFSLLRIRTSGLDSNGLQWAVSAEMFSFISVHFMVLVACMQYL